MANYLTLTNLVCKRVNEAVLTTSTFDGAAGAHSTIKDSINATIREINHKYPEWPWNKNTYNFDTTAGVEEYTPDSAVGNIDWDTFYIARNDSASPPITACSLPLQDYTAYAQYTRPADQNAESTGWCKPLTVSRGQGKTIILSPFPNTVYNINYEAWAVPDELETYDDVCSIPDRYNHVIVEGALRLVYQFRDNQPARAASAQIFKDGVESMLRIEINNPVQLRSSMLRVGVGSPWIAPRTF